VRWVAGVRREGFPLIDRADRLFAVPVWRETPFFSSRERAALAWTEAVTDIGRSGVSDVLYDEARTQFTDKELVDLTMAVIAINAWNRLAVALRTAVGTSKRTVATTTDTAQTSA
jgi:alkylhydroperoxidase family enzyme